MQVGVNTMSFMWKTSAREALETLAREGYRCFEVMAQRPHFDPFMERAEALEFARFLHDAGLTVETINMPSLDQNLASASPEMRDYTVRLFERLVDIAQTIEAAAVVVVTGRVNPLITPSARTWKAGLAARSSACYALPSEPACVCCSRTFPWASIRVRTSSWRSPNASPVRSWISAMTSPTPTSSARTSRQACVRCARGWALFTCPTPASGLAP